MTITAIAVLIFSADHLYTIDVKTILAILATCELSQLTLQKQMEYAI